MQHLELDSTDLNWLAGLARALVREDAEDLVQDAVALALDGRVPEGVAPRAWLGGVVRRLASQRYRGEGRRRRREVEVARGEALPETAELVARVELAERVAAVARGLEEPLRRTVLLHFMEGCSIAEIAAREAKPADTVRWRLRRGLEQMRAELVRGSGRDWEAWCAALAPLADLRRGAGASMGGASGILGGTLAAVAAMKWTTIGVAAAGALVLWFGWSAYGSADAELAGPQGAARSVSLAGTQEPERRVAERVAGPTASEPTRTAAATVEAQVARATAGWAGRVVDGAGLPVPGAWVYLVGEAPAARVTADSQGRFELPLALAGEAAADARRDLGCVANGFLRRIVAGLAAGSADLVLQLERGARLSGRVVDADGFGVPDLELLAHGEGAGIWHVSPSQMELRGERALTSREDSGYQQCRARTDSSGHVVFTGLAPGPVDVRSLDPGWVVDSTDSARAGDSFVVWPAARALGVNLTVIDDATSQPVAKASAVFRVELDFADGERVDLGQWVGRGAGGARLVLDGDALPPELRGRRIVRARFFGTVQREAGVFEAPFGEPEPTDWSAEPLVDPSGVLGVAEARVVLAADPAPVELPVEAAAEPDPGPLPIARLEFDVRYADATPALGELVVEWRSTSEQGGVRVGEQRAQSTGAGRYALDVVAGTVELQLSDARASGSLAPWTGRVECAEGTTQLVAIELPRGARVELQRPSGWEGEWFVHAARRNGEQGEWRGSWTYSTREASLELAALEPAEWRFRFSPDREFEGPVIERRVMLEAGDEAQIEARE